MPKERVFFDEHIYSAAAIGQLSVDQWRKSIQARNCECILTAITLLELLEWLRVSRDDNSFRTAQYALSLARDFGGKHIVGFPSFFLKEKIFGIKEAPRGFGQKDLQRWHRVGMKAKTRSELLGGQVALTETRTKTYGLDLCGIRDTLDKARALLNDQISDAIAKIRPEDETHGAIGNKTFLPKERLAGLDRVLRGEKLKTKYAARIIEFVGLSKTIELTPAIVSKVMASVDAHFTHSCFIKRQALTSTYNFRRDTGLVVDSQMLFYLADPACVLVTNDGALRKAIAGSIQSARALGFDEFCAHSRRL
jgi:hypothetical protein